MMSGLTTAEMSRIVVVGTIDELSQTLELAARLKAIHVIDHDGEELSIGTPNQAADDISRRLAAMRGCMSQLNPVAESEVIQMKTMQRSLDGSLLEQVDSAIEDLKRLESVNTELEQLQEQREVLEKLAPVGLDLELLSGYDSLSASIGIVPNLMQCTSALGSLAEDV